MSKAARNSRPGYMRFMDICAMLATSFAAGTFAWRVVDKETHLSDALRTALLVVSVVISFAVGFYSSRIARITRSFAATQGLVPRRVFVAYGNEYHDFALKVAERLRDKGMRVWDLKEQIRPGDKLRSTIAEAISDSDVMLLLLPRKIDDLLRWQVDLALANNLKIIPVRLDADSAVIKKVAGLAPLDLSSEDETQLGRITEAIS